MGGKARKPKKKVERRVSAEEKKKRGKRKIGKPRERRAWGGGTI